MKIRFVRNVSSKLTHTQAREIKRLYKNKSFKQKKLAASYNVSQSIVSRIVRGTIHK